MYQNALSCALVSQSRFSEIQAELTHTDRAEVISIDLSNVGHVMTQQLLYTINRQLHG